MPRKYIPKAKRTVDDHANAGVNAAATDAAFTGDVNENAEPSTNPSTIHGIDASDPADYSHGVSGNPVPNGDGGDSDPEPKRRKWGVKRRKKARKQQPRTEGVKLGTPSGGAKEKKTPVHLAGLESLLLSVHAMGAAILKVPELTIDPKEAHVLAEAASNVMQFYPYALDEKTTAWVNLGMVAAGVYGTRALAFHNRMRQERIPKISPPPAGPVPVQPNGLPYVPGIPVPPVD